MQKLLDIMATLRDPERGCPSVTSSSGAIPERAMAGVGHALPALARAVKLGRRAAGVGFDWPDLAGVLAKVHEELAEVESARSGTPDELAEEIGDLLFTVANLARHADVDPEEALRRANLKFERRFDQLELRVRSSGREWAEFTDAELDSLWNLVKGGS